MGMQQYDITPRMVLAISPLGPASWEARDPCVSEQSPHRRPGGVFRRYGPALAILLKVPALPLWAVEQD